ncbi:MAG: hypothetical protein MR598_02410 [Erysipelotrichaceae bacterium]|nr:hypothetical protein [Erysipelotrichaceae bacterium]
MKNMECENGKHRYGLWNIVEKEHIVWRKCEECSHILTLPISEMEVEYSGQIRMQKEAALFFKAFQNVSNQDENIIGYLNVILRDYATYLGPDNLEVLIHRMDEIEQSDVVDTKNALYINEIQSHLKLNNMDFDDTLYQFQVYNGICLTDSFSNNPVEGRHM